MRTIITTIKSILLFFFILVFVFSCSILRNPYTEGDRDGVSEKKDKCPDTPPGIVVDENGCPLDIDNDGVPDFKDDCPDVPGDINFAGCADRDGDAIPDKDDYCPDTPGIAKFYGCPDSDEDGVPDPKDKCPNTPKGCPVDATGCPLDSDGDGVINCEDKCPTEIGPRVNDGCPAWAEKLLPDQPDQITKPSDETNVIGDNENDLIHDSVPKQDILLRRATGGIAYSKNIRSLEEGTLRVFVKINASPAQVRSTIRKTEIEEYQVEVNRDTTTIFIITNIEVYDSLIVQPLYSASDFSLTPVRTQLKQKLDLNEGNQWLWKVRAESKEPRTATITIQMDGTTPKGMQAIAIRHIPIEITILVPPEPTNWQKILKWVGEKMEYIISAFIAAFVGYLIKWIFEKKKKNNEMQH